MRCLSTVLSSSSEVEQHRDHACTCYDVCLELAATLAWTSFSCSRCPGYLEDKELWATYLYRLTQPGLDIFSLDNVPYETDRFSLELEEL